MKISQKETFWQLTAISKHQPVFVRTSLAELSDNGQPDQILMHMIDGFSVLKASIDKEKIDELASDVRGIDYDDFVAFTTEALTGQGSESVYQLVDRENKTKQLLWKRKIPDTENSFQLGNVYFHPIENERDALNIFNQICSFCATNLAQLNVKNLELEVDYLRFSQENQEMKQALEEFVEQKEKWESEVYEQFAAILNSKKRKIRELEEEIEELKKNEKTKTENFSEFSPSASKKFRLAVENSSVEKTEKNFTSIHENEKATEEKNEENSMETDEEKEEVLQQMETEKQQKEENILSKLSRARAAAQKKREPTAAAEEPEEYFVPIHRTKGRRVKKPTPAASTSKQPSTVPNSRQSSAASPAALEQQISPSRRSARLSKQGSSNLSRNSGRLDESTEDWPVK